MNYRHELDKYYDYLGDARPVHKMITNHLLCFADWLNKSCATQPVIEADAEKVPKCCADMKPDPLGYDCVCPICGRTA